MASEKYKGKIYYSASVTWSLLFFSTEDEAAATRITAKNGLESYAYPYYIYDATTTRHVTTATATIHNHLDVSPVMFW